MGLSPDATLDPATRAAVADAYGLGEPVDAIFIARGSMGAVNRMDTTRHGVPRSWTVKRAYWNQYTEPDIATQVDFTERCESVGVLAPRSIQRIDGGGFVLTVETPPDGETQYRVLEWVEGEVVQPEETRAIPLLADWMGRIHTLGIDPAGQPVDDWFVRVTYDWDDLATRLAQRAPDIADLLRARRTEIRELTDFVNTVQEPGAVWCHCDMGTSNLVWGPEGPRLIDWENSGPFVPHQELGTWLRGLGPMAKSTYRAYRQAGGPAEITSAAHIASSAVIHLNYVGVQAELLLNDDHPEQHDFARAQVSEAAPGLPTIESLEAWIKELSA